jgi:hypothetical protein
MYFNENLKSYPELSTYVKQNDLTVECRITVLYRRFVTTYRFNSVL